jgi:catechol 2,3-dioxygenase-like lactoylglutathione lyase family enzyme
MRLCCFRHPGTLFLFLTVFYVQLSSSFFLSPLSATSASTRSSRVARAAAPSSEDGGRPRVLPHHTALWVKNITASMAFYSLLGFEEERRFKAGPARAVWLQQQPLLDSTNFGAAPADQGGHCLELIEVPPHLTSSSSIAAESISQDGIVRTGMNHLALDVSEECRASGGDGGLPDFLRHLNERSEAVFDRSIRLVVAPHERIIGQDVFEVGFIADPDGVLLELLSCSAHPISQPLEPPCLHVALF